jgi:DNA-binding CsgD family transcriptional regulator
MTGKMKEGDAFVAICDWHGRVQWSSNSTIKTQVGDLGWSNMIDGDDERFKEAFSRTATLHERHIVEIESRDGLRYRIWLWPVGNPDMAVCTFNLRIPYEIGQLSDREREFMVLLAHGQTLKQIATTLDVSLSTVNSHMRNVRKKLKLCAANEVVSFAARFFHHGVNLKREVAF